MTGEGMVDGQMRDEQMTDECINLWSDELMKSWMKGYIPVQVRDTAIYQLLR